MLSLQNRITINSVVNSASSWTNQYSVLLGGVDEYINADTLQSALSATTVGTWSVWVKPVTATPAGFENLIVFGDTNADTDILINIFATTGVLQARCRLAGTNQWSLRTDAVPFTSGVWSHVALVQDGVSPVIYINGSAVAQTFFHTLDKTAWFSDVPLVDNGRLGCANVNSLGNFGFINGNIDEVLFVNRALSAAQVLNIYNSGNPKDESAITNGISLYRFDGDTVSTCTDTIGSNTATYVNVEQADIELDVP